jgi:xylulokinase
LGAYIVSPCYGSVAVYLGFDCSTQSLSAVIIDVSNRTVVFRESINFDSELPHFGTVHGVLPSPAPGVVHAPPLMWKAALHAMFARISTCGLDPGALRAISGSAQQHGSVYCGEDPDTLARSTAPIWMDSSTARECDEITRALDGAQAVADLTGSPPHARFTGPQIRKFAREEPAAYAATERIHLVSSWLASLLIGSHGPVDHADASGMNLMDLRAREWSGAALAATAPDLAVKLPPLVRSDTVVGVLHEGWQKRFAMPAVRVVAWSGDNPCSLVGTGVVREGQLAVSLGTSDTIFGAMVAPRVSVDGTGHAFASPTGDYMGITVFRNGSLARELVRNQFGLNWEGFSAALRSTDAGNGGALMLPWLEPEITPVVPRALPRSTGLDGAPPARHVRAIVEAQMLAMAIHSAWMGVTPRTIYATGGGAANRDILQVMADVFDADVVQSSQTNSAALGAAIRAFQADTGVSWQEATDGFLPPVTSRLEPVGKHAAVYQAARHAYRQLEAAALDQLTAAAPSDV